MPHTQEHMHTPPLFHTLTAILYGTEAPLYMSHKPDSAVIMMWSFQEVSRGPVCLLLQLMKQAKEHRIKWRRTEGGALREGKGREKMIVGEGKGGMVMCKKSEKEGELRCQREGKRRDGELGKCPDFSTGQEQTKKLPHYAPKHFWNKCVLS